MIYKLTYGNRSVWFTNFDRAYVAYKRVTPSIVDDDLRIHNKVSIDLYKWQTGIVNPAIEVRLRKNIYLDDDGVHITGDK